MYLVGPALAATIAVSATPAYWTEMKSIGDMREKTIEFRLDLWTIALRMFEDNPITGVGPGNFVWNAGEDQSSEQFERYQRSLAANAVTHSMGTSSWSPNWGSQGSLRSGLCSTEITRT